MCWLRVLLVLFLAFTGLAKLVHPESPPSSIHVWVSLGEFALAFLLLVPNWRGLGAAGVCLFLLVAVAYHFTEIVAGKSAEACGCMGAQSLLTHAQTLVVAGATLSVALFVWRYDRPEVRT